MEEIQNKVKLLQEKYNLRETPEHSILDLTSELGELSKEILLSTNYGKKEREEREEIEEELGDVFFSLIVLANQYNIKLEESLNTVFAKLEKRFKEKGHIGSK